MPKTSSNSKADKTTPVRLEFVFPRMLKFRGTFGVLHPGDVIEQPKVMADSLCQSKRSGQHIFRRTEKPVGRAPKEVAPKPEIDKKGVTDDG